MGLNTLKEPYVEPETHAAPVYSSSDGVRYTQRSDGRVYAQGRNGQVYVVEDGVSRREVVRDDGAEDLFVSCCLLCCLIILLLMILTPRPTVDYIRGLIGSMIY